MSFKYVNPGYSALLNSGISATDYDSSTYNPSNGIAFRANTTAIALTFDSGTKEIWVKLGIYLTTTDLPRVYIYNTSSVVTGIRINTTFIYIFNYVSNASTTANYSTILNGYHEFLMHIKSDTTNGIFQIYLDGTSIYSYSGSVNNGLDMPGLYLHSAGTSGTGAANYFSNLIVSDSEILTTEKVAILPMTNTVNEWTDDGTYSVSATGKKIVQTPDILTLRNNIGSTSIINVKSLQVNALDVSYSSPVTALKSVCIENSAEVDPETKALSTSAWYTNALSQNPVTNTDWSLSDLENMQIGIESAAS